MDAILQVAREHKLMVVGRRGAGNRGAVYKGGQAGTLETWAVFRFILPRIWGGYGDGGLVASNDDSLAELVNILRVHGSKQRYYHSHIGINGRLDALAAILSVKLEYLDEWSEKRRLIASYYSAHLEGLPIRLPVIAPYNTHIFHQYVIAVSKRDALRSYLGQQGVESAISNT